MGTPLADEDIARQNVLAPNRLLLESRPFLVEPTPFLWAKNCRPMFIMIVCHPFCEIREVY